MKVIIAVTDWFTRYTSNKREILLVLEKGASAMDAAIAVGIPASEVGFLTVNQIKVEEQHLLKDGDIIKVYSMIVGG